MPKEAFSYLAYKQRSQFNNILKRSIKAPSSYKSYVKKDLKHIVKLLTSFYAYYIYAKLQCLLVLINTQRRKIRDKQQAAQLRVAKVEAKLAVT